MTDIVELQKWSGTARNTYHDPAMSDAFDTAIAEIKRLRSGGCARDQKTTQYCAEVVERDSEITRLRAASKWQPIETAPKDWNEILVWDGISIRVVKHAYDDEHGNPKWAPEGLPFLYATHWQPLPSPPTQEGDK